MPSLHRLLRRRMPDQGDRLLARPPAELKAAPMDHQNPQGGELRRGRGGGRLPNNASCRCSGEQKGGTAAFPIGARANERLRGFTALTLACPGLLLAAAAHREASVRNQRLLCRLSSRREAGSALPATDRSLQAGRQAGRRRPAVLSGFLPSQPARRRGEGSCPRC